ncbi:MAG: hypothetical protein KGI49_03515, partial [Patescibacteria group bacterium]|nr:hypothetical protein [Patescibacteria group bacterium]
EAYVLPTDYFWAQLNGPPSAYALTALTRPADLRITIYVVLGVLVVYLLNFLFRRTRLGYWLHRAPERLSFMGPIFVRAAIAAAFFYSALSWSFLGPELSLNAMPLPWLMRGVLFAASGMIAFGFLTELAAAAALAVFTIGYWKFGLYLMTYFNYLGEMIVLVLFGMRKWSLDRLMFGALRRFPKFRDYETSIVRIFYGIALIYAAITVKFLHPAMTARVVTDWHLTQFHWLFPSDPLLVVLGAGLAEFAIGFFIMIGFEMRLTVIISLFYITLSLLYFRELVWPHLMLYGISLSLLVKPEVFTLDHYLFERERKKAAEAGIRWWKRPFLPHTQEHVPEKT